MAGDRIGICSALRVVLTESPGEPGPEVDSGTSRKTKATSLPVTEDGCNRSAPVVLTSFRGALPLPSLGGSPALSALSKRKICVLIFSP